MPEYAPLTESGGDSVTELPEPGFETEIDPEFSHLRPRRSDGESGASSGTRMNGPAGNGSSDMPSVNGEDQSIDLPEPALEDQSKYNRLPPRRHSLDTPASHAEFTRPTAPPAARRNPLRGSQPFPPTAAVQAAALVQPGNHFPATRAVAVEPTRSVKPAGNPLR